MGGMEARLYETDTGRSQPRDFLDDLPVHERAAILDDIADYAAGASGAVSWKVISGHAPMRELRTWGFRSLFFVQGDVMHVLHVCRKQDQKRGIEQAAKRMKALRQ